MKRTVFVALSAVLGLAVPGIALAECQRPTAPAAVDGATATIDQMKAAKAAVSSFMTSSDDYQACVLKEFTEKKDAAKAAKAKLDPAIAKTADTQISENQAEKERVGVEFNTAAKAYRAAHPS